jgi:hypothetical protein
MTDDMNDFIRGAGPGVRGPAAATPTATAEQLAAAELAGLPERYAHRLAAGPDPAADAQELRADLEAAGALEPAADFEGGAWEGPD